MYEIIGLYVAIGGQYLLLFVLYQKMTTILFEMRVCPYHNEWLEEKKNYRNGGVK